MSSSENEKKKCEHDGCEVMCYKKYCGPHNRKYNICAYEGCGKNCRKEFCSRHNPETLRKGAEYHKVWYEGRREIMKESAKKIQKHKCAEPSCERLCLLDYCRAHGKKLNKCAREGCENNCREEFCWRHKEKYREAQKNYHNRLRALQKNLSPEVGPIISVEN